MRSIFLTGATGVIGSALVPLFLKDKDTQLYLLIRATSSEHLRQRLDELFQFWQIDQRDEQIRERIEPLRGDTSLHQFGLEPEKYAFLCRKVNCIVHSAANVKMNLPLEEARASSVHSAQEIIEFGFACKANGVLDKLEVVSTVGVAGKSQGIVLEQPIKNKREFHNTYEQAKAEAENLFFDALNKGLPITIHRPSMVVGDSQTGKVIHKQVFYYLCQFLSGKSTNGFLPRIEKVRLDIIPTDYVAQAIYLSSGKDNSVGQVFHLCSGTKESIYLSDLTLMLRKIYLQNRDNLPRIFYLPLYLFKCLLLVFILSTNDKQKRALKNLHIFLSYANDSQIFDNRIADSYFSSLGLNIPSVKNYLNQVVTFKNT